MLRCFEIIEIRFAVNSSIACHGQEKRPVIGAFKMERKSSMLIQYAPVSQIFSMDTRAKEWFDFVGRLLQFDCWSEFYGAVEIPPADVSWDTAPPPSTWVLYAETTNGTCCWRGHDVVLPDLPEQLYCLLTASEPDERDMSLVPKDRCWDFGSCGSKGTQCSDCETNHADLYQRCRTELVRNSCLKYVRTPVYRCRDCLSVSPNLDSFGCCGDCHSPNIKTLTGRDWEVSIDESELELMLDFMCQDWMTNMPEWDYIRKIYEWKRTLRAFRESAKSFRSLKG